MKIDFNQVIKNFDGSDLMEFDPVQVDNLSPADLKNPSLKLSKRQIILKNVCVSALNATKENEQISGEIKFKRYELCMKIQDGKFDFTTDEISDIKKSIGISGYSPLVVGQAWNMLEGK